jgi:hypothetical protein
MKPSLRRGNVKWFSTRSKPGAKRRAHRSPMQLIALRMRDLANLYRSRYGIALPDDDAGRDDLKIALNHLACLAHPRGHIAHWIEIWAPWLTAAEQRQVVPPILANPQRWKADALAWRLRLTKEQRTMLGITTIGAIDENKAARTKRRRAKDRQRKENARRAKGVKPRATYEGQSTSKAKPWLEEGISRAQWYRRRARETDPSNETGAATP